MALEPLSEGDSEELLEVLGVQAGVRPQIAEAAEGNPLFVEQLAAIADEFGVLGKMPDSIRGVLHERIDRLDREERSALERAAVAGRSFSLDAVLDLTRGGTRGGSPRACSRWLESGFSAPTRPRPKKASASTMR